jgi:hypothetical protein
LPSPPPWPDRPESAQNFSTFWLVRRLPPQPFPQEGYDYAADDRFGPSGTLWVFTIEALIDRQNVLGTSAATKLAIEKLIKKLGVKLPPLGSTSWTVPIATGGPAAEQEVVPNMPMDWIRTQVVAQLNVDEEIVHVLNWRHSTQENAPLDNATVKLVGNAVRDAWAAWFTPLKDRFHTDLTYLEVRSAALHQDAPATKPTWPLATQVSPFTQPMKGTSPNVALPYEVAMALSLNTNFRGTSRFRGRLYLGALPTTFMSSNGNFDRGTCSQLGQTFGQFVLGGVETATDYECHIISQKYATSAKVTGVRTGVVPDSQRRRRKDRVEGYVQNWGTPVGGL